MTGKEQLDELSQKYDELIESFKHTHVSLYKKGELQDKCAACGLDLRHPVHCGVEEQPNISIKRKTPNS